MRMLFAALAITLSVSAVTAQDAITALPDSYSKQFENEWVKVVRVYYPPNARLPAHTHNALPAAYVYLNDGGPVLFKHIGTTYGAATRPATRAGGFRIFRGLDEIHEVENLSELPSEFLRVEFKTDPRDVRTLKGRFYRENIPADQNLEHVQFENDQIRITRVTCVPGRTIRISAAASEPALLIALRQATLRESGGAPVDLRLGQERWIGTSSTVTFENAGAHMTEFLRFDFKTPPVVPTVQR